MSKDFQLNIDDIIGPYGYSKQYVTRKISENKGKQMNVRVNSFGGSLDDALCISDAFYNHGNVSVYMCGFNASAATVLTLGAKHIAMSSSGFYLVHKVSNLISAWGMMNADEIQDIIDELTKNKKENDKIDLILAQKYATRCKKPIADIVECLKKAEWLTAEEALKMGFIDEIIQDSSKLNFSPNMVEKFNAFGLPPVPILPSDNKTILDKIEEGFSDIKKIFQKSNQHNSFMSKEYKAIINCLEIDAIEFTNGKISFSTDQAEKLNSFIANLSKERDSLLEEKANLEQSVKNKDEQITILQNSPGDKTKQIHNESTHNGEDNDTEYIKKSRDLFNLLS